MDTWKENKGDEEALPPTRIPERVTVVSKSVTWVVTGLVEEVPDEGITDTQHLAKHDGKSPGATGRLVSKKCSRRFM